MGFGQRPCAGSGGSALSLPKASAKQRPCAAVSGLALSVIASRCHLSQSERPWQSAKFPVLHFTPCCRKGSRQALRGDFPPLPRAPPLGKTPSGRREMSHMRQREDSWREAPERARMLTRSCALGLALPYGSAAPSEARSKPRLCAAGSGLALSVIASRCHLSQSERPWQSVKFPVYTLRPAAARGAEGVTRRLSAFAKGSPFGGAGKAVRL